MTKLLIGVLFCIIAVLGYIVYDLESKQLPVQTYSITASVDPATELPRAMGPVRKVFELPADEPVPSITFTMKQGVYGDWIINAKTTNFTFAPISHLDGSPVPGEGHLHLYIDNNLVLMFSDIYHIDSLAPGEHVIKVGIFNNDHSAYMVGTNQIIAEKTINVTATSGQTNPMNDMTNKTY